MTISRLPTLVAALAAIPAIAFAQGVATEAYLAPVTVSETRAPLDPNLPNSTASKTARELEQQNIFNPEDALQHLPSTTVRKRFFGDRNANLGGRSFGTLEPGRGLVYLDGYLISTFLGRFDAPRWNMVNAESIERVDMLYGPYSAIYPGNSIGTTAVITERKPQGFEASASVKYHRQGFKEYGTDAVYDGSMSSARMANRLGSGLWYSLGLQHQDVTGQPMGFANRVRGDSGQFGAPGGTLVSGIIYDKDPSNKDRAIFAANGIDHSIQDAVNLRLGYAISSTQEVEGRLSYWHNDSTTRAQTYLRKTDGTPVWSGIVNDGTYSFNLDKITGSFAPSQRMEDHAQLGFTWRTRHAKGWNASVVATNYSILSDVERKAGSTQPVAELGGKGEATRRDGTGWNTFEIQTTYTPQKGDWGNGKHALTFGLHRNHYQLSNVTYKTLSDWRFDETTLDQRYTGKTLITAFYGQDAWKLAPDWLLTAGVRQEAFKAYEGSQFIAGTTAVDYAQRRMSATSPKLSLAWSARDDLLLRASAGKGVRFPNVDELFNGAKSTDGTRILVNDPTLRPERSHSLELSAEWFLERHSLRASLFHDDVADSILKQKDPTDSAKTTVSNVDRVVTRGLELVWQGQDVGIKGLDFSGSATWADARIAANAKDPATVGKNWPRIPMQRYSLQASYRPNDKWLLSAAWRWHGRMYNTADNSDVNPETYGGTSRVNQIDLRSSYRIDRAWTASFGINNLTNAQAWQGHSLPQRSIQADLRYSLK